VKLTAQSLVIFKVSSTGVRGGIQFKPEEWGVFAQVDGKRTIADIAQQLGMDPNIVWRIAESLYQRGLLQPAAGSEIPSEVVDEKFFPQLTRELLLVMGAVADILIDEQVSAMRESRERFPKARAPELVERVSQSIRNESKRLKFQQGMLDSLRKL
jgi:hypothetical protein